MINKVVYLLQAELKSLNREAQIDRIERVMRRSDIVRDKWDEPRAGVPWIHYVIRSALDTFNDYSRENPQVDLNLDEIENLTQAQAKALREKLAPEEAGTTVLTRLESRGDEVDDLVDELFCGVGVSSVIGQPGDGKTTFVVAMCEKICTQQNQFLGRNIASPDPDRPRAVFYVAAEAARGVEKRWLANLKADGLNPDDFDRFFQVRTNPAWMHDEEELLKVSSMIRLYELAEGVKVVAVIFDTFRANAKEGSKENDNNDMARAIKNVERKISDRLNCNSIIIHHMPKGNVVDAVGGGAYKAGLDQMMAIQPVSRVKDADGGYTATFRVKGVKNRDDAPELMNVNFKLRGIPIGLFKKSGKELTGAHILPIGEDEIKQTPTQLVRKKRKKQTLELLAVKDYRNMKSLANDLDLKDTRKVSAILKELSKEGLVKFTPKGKGNSASSSITAKGRRSLTPKTDFEIEAGIDV